MAKLKYRSLTW